MAQLISFGKKAQTTFQTFLSGMPARDYVFQQTPYKEQMPDSVCDVKLLKKSIERNQGIIKAADKRIEKWAEKIKHGKYPKDGLYFYDRIAGFICQRLWCYGKTKDYSDKLKINHNCTECGLCVRLCPMGNLVIKNSKAIAGNRCTMCYRCISSCPQQAITLLGDTVVEQCRYERYVYQK